MRLGEKLVEFDNGNGYVDIFSSGVLQRQLFWIVIQNMIILNY